MNPALTRFLLALTARAVWVTLWETNLAVAEPFLPRDGGQVLEHLRTAALDSDARHLRELRARLAADPGNLDLASQFARGCIERSRGEADPRYLGRAQAALAPWWNSPAAPAEALLLRATIRQSQHDFTSALADLELAIEKDPRSAQAWLTRATILTVVGDYPAARRACIPLAQLAPGLVALTAAANVSCLSGEAERGTALLRNAVDSFPNATENEQVWALTVLAEASARLGNEAEAEGFFKQALRLERHDPYLQSSYADLLLEQGRVQEAAALLGEGPRADAALLRLALAESKLQPTPAGLSTHIDALRARFEAGHLRGDFVHQREEAIFALHLLRSPRDALRLAQANWRVQREPADARILLESALAAQDRAAAQPVLEFMRASRIQDLRLNALAKKFDRGIER